MARRLPVSSLMKNPLLATATSVLLMFGVGCAGSAQYSATATVETPRLILIEPDVQVVADYDQPVFYSENYYWRYDNGVWYRSNSHLRGWVRFEAVPARIRRIDRPTAYIRYRGEARGTANGQVRDHRDHQPPPPPAYQPPPVVNNPTPPPAYQPPPPVVRTPPPPIHNSNPGPMSKDERKDAKQDAKEERKEAKAEAKANAKDDRADAKEERAEAKAAAKMSPQDAAKLHAKDAKQDAKEERKEAKAEAKADRKDDKADAKEERKDAAKAAKKNK